FERGHIARPFGVRVLAEYHDRDVGTGVELARLAQPRRAARGRDAARDARVDGLRVRKVLVGLGALPGDRPAAALLGDVIGPITTSRPALSAAAQLSGVHPGSCAWPFQSPSTRPSKPMRPFSTSVRSAR